MSSKRRPSQKHCDYLELDGIFLDHASDSSEERADLNGLADELKERYTRLLMARVRMNERNELDRASSTNEDGSKGNMRSLKENIVADYTFDSAETIAAEHQEMSNYARKFVREGKFGCDENEYELLPEKRKLTNTRENTNYNSDSKKRHGTEQAQIKSSERVSRKTKDDTLRETRHSVSNKVRPLSTSSNLGQSAILQKTNNANTQTHGRISNIISRERPESASRIPSPIEQSAGAHKTKNMESSGIKGGLLPHDRTLERQMTRRAEVDSRKDRSVERKSKRSRTLSPEERSASRPSLRREADSRHEKGIERTVSRSRTLSPQERSAGRQIGKTEAGARQDRSVETTLTIRSRAVSPDRQSSDRSIERKNSGSRPSSRQEESIRKHISRTAGGVQKDRSLERNVTRSRTVSPEYQSSRRQRVRSESASRQERSPDRKVTRSRTLSPQEQRALRPTLQTNADSQTESILGRKGTKGKAISPQERSAGRSRTLSPHDRDSERQNTRKQTISTKEDERKTENTRSRITSPHRRSCPLYESTDSESTVKRKTAGKGKKAGRRKLVESNELIVRKTPGVNVRVYNDKTAERILPCLEPERKSVTREFDTKRSDQTMTGNQDVRPDASYTISHPVSPDNTMRTVDYNRTNCTAKTTQNSFEAQSKLYNEALSSEYNTPSVMTGGTSNSFDARQATYIVCKNDTGTPVIETKELGKKTTHKHEIRDTVVKKNNGGNGNALEHDIGGLKWDQSEDEGSEAEDDIGTMQDHFSYDAPDVHLFRPYAECKQDTINRSGWNRQTSDRYIDDEETYQQIQEKIFMSGTAVIVKMMKEEVRRTVVEEFDVSFWAATHRNILDLEMDVDNFSACMNADHSYAAEAAIEDAERRLHQTIDDLLVPENTSQSTAFSLMVHEDVNKFKSRLKSAAYDLGSRKQMQMLLPEIKQVLLDLRLLTECFSLYGEQFFAMAAATREEDDTESECGILARLSDTYASFMCAMRNFRCRLSLPCVNNTGRQPRASTSRQHPPARMSDSVHSVHSDHMSPNCYRRRHTFCKCILTILMGVAFCFLLAVAVPKIVTSIPLMIDAFVRMIAAVWGALSITYRCPGLI